MRRVFVDTSVLFPFSVMDVFLGLSEDAIHRVVWTDELLDEWERVIIRERRRSPETAASVTAAIREFFADGRIDRNQYDHLIDEMPGKDRDDRPHMAAAIAARADALVTSNTADFPAAPLAALGLRVVGPDIYLNELLDDHPQEVIATIVRIAAEKTRPPKTPADILNALRGAGLREFPDRAQRRL